MRNRKTIGIRVIKEEINEIHIKTSPKVSMGFDGDALLAGASVLGGISLLDFGGHGGASFVEVLGAGGMLVVVPI
jgi:hypothetical protein